jgi:hypothetical protein
MIASVKRRLAWLAISPWLIGQALSAGTAHIELPDVIMVEPAATSAMQIGVGPPESLPQQAYLRVRGLPPRLTLSDGHAISAGVWAIPLFALAGLKVTVPAGVSGRSELIVSLLDSDGNVLAESKAAILIAPTAWMAGGKPTTKENTDSQARVMPLQTLVPTIPTGKLDRGQRPPTDDTLPPAKSTTLTPPPSFSAPLRPLPQAEPPTTPKPPPLSIEEKLNLEKLIATGDRALLAGNIVHARQFYRHVADRGIALAAFKLAETFDPSELARLQVVGMLPDAAEARRWYQLARQLGDTRAEARLQRLPAK